MGVALVVLTCLSACGQDSLHNAQGHPIRAQQWKNKWVFINIWAPWCHPCHQEIPALNQFAQAHKSEVLVLGYNFDGPTAEVLKKQIRSLSINFQVTIEDPSTYFPLKPSGVVPTTYVINPKGVLVQTLIGPQKIEDLNRVFNHQLMKESKAEG